MTRQTLSVFLTLCSACLLTTPVAASQPAGLAGELIAETYPSDLSCSSPRRIEAYLSFGEQSLSSGDTLTLDFALVPFSMGDTWITMDGMEGTFMGFSFANGNVTDAEELPTGLRYNRFGWNDVTVLLRTATQDFIVTVNGAQAGPFPFSDFCPARGGCYSANALRIDTNTNDAGGAIAWVDTVTIARDSPAGYELFATRTFDRCDESWLFQTLNGVIITEKPPRLRTKK